MKSCIRCKRSIENKLLAADILLILTCPLISNLVLQLLESAFSYKRYFAVRYDKQLCSYHEHMKYSQTHAVKIDPSFVDAGVMICCCWSLFPVATGGSHILLRFGNVMR